MTDPGYPPCAVAHIGLSVSELQRAADWYQRALGFRLLAGPFELKRDDTYAGRAAADVFGPLFREVRIAHLASANGVVLELFEFVEPSPKVRDVEVDYWDPGVTHICVVDPDIEARVEAITRAGGKARTQIWQVFEGEPYRFCHCEDPYGNVVEVYTHSHEQVFANRSPTPAR
jgi:catechol 2,3-dioxygenase-like lactoylglutathione lyase family enzyme